ncbi:putative nepenthesin [Rosa chinensis]|uniref:Putative nepenthesin n=1 Tax=Rosa chinensis TaxID=74649 RepID=A0A2P6RGA3_ROSCH|nr:aspartic proteinase PCS1 [Rosa chinensis]PRQ45461.1 putative nepenthesin [Rosa chinensis]
MALFFFFFFCSLFPLSLSSTTAANLSISFPLFTPHSRPSTTNPLHDSLISSKSVVQPKGTPSYNYKLPFKYSMAPIVSLPIGTPPQTQQMVLDTGSQLSWIQCHKKVLRKAPPPASIFDPSLSSTFSVLPCNHPICKPRVPDFTLPTTCDQNRLCHYSYFYADGTLAEGNLVREKFTFSRATSTPPLTLGCAQDTSDTKGILGMNLGRLSFPSQAKITKFSYCIPTRPAQTGSPSPTGTFYLGNNPNSATFRYVDLLTFGQSQRMPNLDPLAYTVVMLGVRIGGNKLSILPSVFRPDASGAGQTMIDSGCELTYFVDEAYNKVKEEIVKLVGPKLKKGYVYANVADMCFDSNIGPLIGDMVLEFDKGVEIVIAKEHILHNVEGKVWCVAIGRSDMIGAASNIIGNVHQQNQWVEFDLANRRVGFGKADCSIPV